MTSLRSKLIITAIVGFFLPLIIFTFYYLFQPHRSFASAKVINSEITPTSIPIIINPPTPSPTSVPTPTTILSTKIYKDSNYNFKISFPSSWQGVFDPKNNLGQTYTIYSPNDSESLEILISNGIWANVELEIGPKSRKASFLGSSCLIYKDGKKTVYVFPSKISGKIFRLSITGNSPQITKVFNSFKFI
jgi:hypothetical protein